MAHFIVPVTVRTNRPADFFAVQMKLSEQFTHRRHVIQAEDEFALDASKQVAQFDKIITAKNPGAVIGPVIN